MCAYAACRYASQIYFIVFSCKTRTLCKHTQTHTLAYTDTQTLESRNYLLQPLIVVVIVVVDDDDATYIVLLLSMSPFYSNINQLPPCCRPFCMSVCSSFTTSILIKTIKSSHENLTKCKCSKHTFRTHTHAHTKTLPFLPLVYPDDRQMKWLTHATYDFR